MLLKTIEFMIIFISCFINYYSINFNINKIICELNYNDIFQNKYIIQLNIFYFAFILLKNYIYIVRE